MGLKVIVNTSVGLVAAFACWIYFTVYRIPEGMPTKEALSKVIDLGPVGDYVGGILNPAISLLALIWLSQSFLAQKQELKETKDALKKSAEAQQEMTNQAIKQTRIAALAALISSVTAEVNVLQSHLQFLLTQDGHRKGQGVYDQDGSYLLGPTIPARISQLNSEIKRELSRQEAHENELRQLLLVLTIEQSHDQQQPDSH